METITERCAGRDVHKAHVTACVRVPDPGGGYAEQVAEFATTVAGLVTLARLAGGPPRQVAMEAVGSTGSRSGRSSRTPATACC